MDRVHVRFCCAFGDVDTNGRAQLNHRFRAQYGNETVAAKELKALSDIVQTSAGLEQLANEASASPSFAIVVVVAFVIANCSC